MYNFKTEFDNWLDQKSKELWNSNKNNYTIAIPVDRSKWISDTIPVHDTYIDHYMIRIYEQSDTSIILFIHLPLSNRYIPMLLNNDFRLVCKDSDLEYIDSITEFDDRICMYEFIKKYYDILVLGCRSTWFLAGMDLLKCLAKQYRLPIDIVNKLKAYKT